MSLDWNRLEEWLWRTEQLRRLLEGRGKSGLGGLVLPSRDGTFPPQCDWKQIATLASRPLDAVRTTPRP